MNCKGDEDIDAKRSRPSIGKPASCHARKERVPLIGTDQRITSGPAATMAAFRGRIHDCTRTLRTTVRFPLHRGPTLAGLNPALQRCRDVIESVTRSHWLGAAVQRHPVSGAVARARLYRWD